MLDILMLLLIMLVGAVAAIAALIVIGSIIVLLVGAVWVMFQPDPEAKAKREEARKIWRRQQYEELRKEFE